MSRIECAWFDGRRLALEIESTSQPDTAHKRRWQSDFNESKSFRHNCSVEERARWQRPLGTFTAKDRYRATWALESLAGLAWASGLLKELPALTPIDSVRLFAAISEPDENAVPPDAKRLANESATATQKLKEVRAELARLEGEPTADRQPLWDRERLLLERLRGMCWFQVGGNWDQGLRR